MGIELEYRLKIFNIENSFWEESCKFAENLIGENVFFNDRFIGRGKKTYLNYGDIFKYQYEKIGNLTFNDLFERVNYDLDEIMNSLDKIKKQIPTS